VSVPLDADLGGIEAAVAHLYFIPLDHRAPDVAFLRGVSGRVVAEGPSPRVQRHPQPSPDRPVAPQTVARAASTEVKAPAATAGDAAEWAGTRGLDLPSTTLGIILGGGAGTRLYPLTKTRAKPAVPLGANYRLIDIPVSNCLNSGITQVTAARPHARTRCPRLTSRTVGALRAVRSPPSPASRDRRGERPSA